MNTMPSDFTSKDFWSRKEGKAGMILLIPLIAGLVFVTGKYVLPFLVNFVVDLFTFTVFGLATFVTLYVAFHPRTRALASYFFQSIARGLTSIFITIDPIGILKGYVKDLRKKLQEMDNELANLKGQETVLAGKIQKNRGKIAQELSIVQAAAQSGKKSAKVLALNKAGRMDKSNVTLQALLDKMKALHVVLEKMYEASDFMIQDIESEVEVREEEYKLVNSAKRTLDRAISIIKGGGEKAAIYDETLEYLTQNYGQKIGEIEHFMQTTKGFLERVDLENMAMEENAMKMLEELEQRADSMLILNEPAKQLAPATLEDAKKSAVSTRQKIAAVQKKNYI
jgi:hypothetical protein